MSVKIETGNLKDLAKRTAAEAIVKLAFSGVSPGEVNLIQSVPQNATYKYEIKVRMGNASFKEIKECYEKVLKKAGEVGITSIVFPLLGADSHREELTKVIRIALNALYEANDNLELILVISDAEKDKVKENAPDISHDAIARLVQWQQGSREDSVTASPSYTSLYISMRPREEMPINFPSKLYDRMNEEQNNLDYDDGCREAIRNFFSRYSGSIESHFLEYMGTEDHNGTYISKSAFYDLVQGRGQTKPSKYNLTLAAWAYGLKIGDLNDLLYDAGYSLNNSVKDTFICFAFEENYTIEDVDAWLTAWGLGEQTFAAAAAKNRRRAQRRPLEE